MKQETRICQNCKNHFTIEPEDFAFYEKISVPPPTWCPECRLIRRLIWRNERTLYKRKCDAPGHGEEIISYIASEKPYVVYDQEYWWSDAWDAFAYGRAYDFSKPFFVQLKELFAAVPRACLSTYYSKMVNSAYSNWAGDCKNCYLVTDADFVEDSGYSSIIFQSRECYDADAISASELCYDSFYLNKCYRVVASYNCQGSTDIWFSKNLSGCSSCFGCVNLRNKSHHIFNKPYDKAAYAQEVARLYDGTAEGYRRNLERAAELWRMYPEKYAKGFANTNASGDYIYHSKNVKSGFLVSDVEDSKYVALIHSPNTKDCMDYADWGDNVQRVYDSIACGLGVADLKFCNLTVIESQQAQYSYWCRNVSHVFGCSGIRNKEYCILNKQYTKEEYEALVPKIIRHMDAMPYVARATGDKGQATREIVYRYGEFFPPELSAFAYNESAAQEFFPLTPEEAVKKGYPWRPAEQKQYGATVRRENLPARITEVKDDVLTHTVACAHKGTCNHGCTAAFRIILPELQFYRKMNLPLPALCFFCRHAERFQFRNPFRLWCRTCQCAGTQSGNGAHANTVSHFHGAEHCPNEFETSYAPERPEIVYCEQCYNAEVA